MGICTCLSSFAAPHPKCFANIPPQAKSACGGTTYLQWHICHLVASLFSSYFGSSNKTVHNLCEDREGGSDEEIHDRARDSEGRSATRRRTSAGGSQVQPSAGAAGAGDSVAGISSRG